MSELEISTCAHELIKLYGDNAPDHVAQRIEALAIVGYMAGVALWERIADRVDQLTDTAQIGQRTQH